MNPDKTEFTYFGSRQHLQKCSSDIINVCGHNIKKSESVRYLGGYLDKNLNSKNMLEKNANWLLCYSPKNTIQPYQRIQNMCAKLILARSKYNSSPDAPKELHWLPV